MNSKVVFSFIICFLILVLACVENKKPPQEPVKNTKEPTIDTISVDWKQIEPVNTTPLKSGVVKFIGGEKFLQEDSKKRRDPSDIIKVNNTYYIYYTYLESNDPGFPEGWGGRIWYATSKDGHTWEEQGEALGRGKGWDGAGVYTPNILEYEGMYYLSYTAMPKPFIQETSRANISIAVANSPHGPFKRISTEPLIPNTKEITSVNSFLVDDSVFVIRDGKVFVYHKGFPGTRFTDGKVVRNKAHRTYMTYALADHPKGPYTKLEEPLTRAHEVIAWNNGDYVESFTIGWGAHLMYQSKDGKQFEAVYKLDTENAPNHLRAAGFYREDLTNNHKSSRPNWGVCMSGSGLQRFDIVWP
jgi:hypothetical protein